jgi:hypothetical protein
MAKLSHKDKKPVEAKSVPVEVNSAPIKSISSIFFYNEIKRFSLYCFFSIVKEKLYYFKKTARKNLQILKKK